MTAHVVVLTPEPPAEGGGYTVTVPGLPGCVTHGESVEIALARAREAITLYLDGETAESLARAGARGGVIVATVEAEDPGVPIPPELAAITR